MRPSMRGHHQDARWRQAVKNNLEVVAPSKCDVVKVKDEACMAHVKE